MNEIDLFNFQSDLPDDEDDLLDPIIKDVIAEVSKDSIHYILSISRQSRGIEMELDGSIKRDDDVLIKVLHFTEGKEPKLELNFSQYDLLKKIPSHLRYDKNEEFIVSNVERIKLQKMNEYNMNMSYTLQSLDYIVDFIIIKASGDTSESKNGFKYLNASNQVKYLYQQSKNTTSVSWNDLLSFHFNYKELMNYLHMISYLQCIKMYNAIYVEKVGDLYKPIGYLYSDDKWTEKDYSWEEVYYYLAIVDIYLKEVYSDDYKEFKIPFNFAHIYIEDFTPSLIPELPFENSNAMNHERLYENIVKLTYLGSVDSDVRKEINNFRNFFKLADKKNILRIERQLKLPHFIFNNFGSIREYKDNIITLSSRMGIVSSSEGVGIFSDRENVRAGDDRKDERKNEKEGDGKEGQGRDKRGGSEMIRPYSILVFCSPNIMVDRFSEFIQLLNQNHNFYTEKMKFSVSFVGDEDVEGEVEKANKKNYSAFNISSSPLDNPNWKSKNIKEHDMVIFYSCPQKIFVKNNLEEIQKRIKPKTIILWGVPFLIQLVDDDGNSKEYTQDEFQNFLTTELKSTVTSHKDKGTNVPYLIFKVGSKSPPPPPKKLSNFQLKIEMMKDKRFIDHLVYIYRIHGHQVNAEEMKNYILTFDNTTFEQSDYYKYWNEYNNGIQPESFIDYRGTGIGTHFNILIPNDDGVSKILVKSMKMIQTEDKTPIMEILENDYRYVPKFVDNDGNALFRMWQSPGDGSCFFHAIIKSLFRLKGTFEFEFDKPEEEYALQTYQAKEFRKDLRNTKENNNFSGPEEINEVLQAIKTSFDFPGDFNDNIFEKIRNHFKKNTKTKKDVLFYCYTWTLKYVIYELSVKEFDAQKITDQYNEKSNEEKLQWGMMMKVEKAPLWAKTMRKLNLKSDEFKEYINEYNNDPAKRQRPLEQHISNNDHLDNDPYMSFTYWGASEDITKIVDKYKINIFSLYFSNGQLERERGRGKNDDRGVFVGEDLKYNNWEKYFGNVPGIKKTLSEIKQLDSQLDNIYVYNDVGQIENPQELKAVDESALEQSVGVEIEEEVDVPDYDVPLPDAIKYIEKVIEPSEVDNYKEDLNLNRTEQAYNAMSAPERLEYLNKLKTNGTLRKKWVDFHTTNIEKNRDELFTIPIEKLKDVTGKPYTRYVVKEILVNSFILKKQEAFEDVIPVGQHSRYIRPVSIYLGHPTNANYIHNLLDEDSLYAGSKINAIRGTYDFFKSPYKYRLHGNKIYPMYYDYIKKHFETILPIISGKNIYSWKKGAGSLGDVIVDVYDDLYGK